MLVSEEKHIIIKMSKTELSEYIKTLQAIQAKLSSDLNDSHKHSLILNPHIDFYFYK